MMMRIDDNSYGNNDDNGDNSYGNDGDNLDGNPLRSYCQSSRFTLLQRGENDDNDDDNDDDNNDDNENDNDDDVVIRS